MDMNDSQRIEAPREVVFAALNDTDVLKACIPGCETINKLSDTEMEATVVLKIGPVKAGFGGKVTFSNIDPPNGYTITGEGSGGIAGFAKGGADVRLEADGDATILHYSVKAEVGGKIAQLGSRLIDSTAKKLAGEFFEKFATVVAGPAVLAEGEAPAEGEKKGKWWKLGMG
jgi:carbon monoxide dehydrogenase subunit G